MKPLYRLMDAFEISRLEEIDRSEIIEELYFFQNGKLTLKREFYDIDGFPPDEFKAIQIRQMSLLQNQGVLIGAFQKGTLVGITSVENQPRGKVGNYRKMDILFVSKQYRNQGIGANLLNLAKEKAKLFGGTKLYISAIPSKSTVDFYLREGATLVSEIDKELYQLEPDDIHLEVQIGF